MRAQEEAWLDRVRRVFSSELWTREVSPRILVSWAQACLQFVVLVGQGFANDQLLLRASALTYFTMLSLIPLIAIAFSMVGAFGVSQDLAQFVVERVAAGSPEAGERILEILERVDFAGLGALGATLLFVTTVLAISNVERALNAIWGVKHQRSWMRRFPDYLAVLVVAPLVLGVALSLGTTLQSQALVQRLHDVPGFAFLYTTGIRQAPSVFLCLGFSFLYWFLPNTKVRIGCALFGGLVAALLFTLAQRLYMDFQVGVARSEAVFGAFAALPLLLVWIYLSCAILLLGAEVAFALQHLPFYRRLQRGAEPGPAAREAIGLAIAVRAARAFRGGSQTLAAEALAEDIGVSVRSVRDILIRLERAGIVSARGDPEREGYQLGRAAERVSAADVLAALRGEREPCVGEQPEGAALAKLLTELDRREAELLEPLSLAELARGGVDPSSQRG
jgi:membrane protein